MKLKLPKTEESWNFLDSRGEILAITKEFINIYLPVKDIGGWCAHARSKSLYNKLLGGFRPWKKNEA